MPTATPPTAASAKVPSRGAPRRRGTDRGGQRHLVGGQRRRVVEQALTAEQDHGAARQAQPPADRRRRHRVGRRHDRTEGQRRRDRELGNRLVRDEPDRERRGQRKSDCQQADGTKVLPQRDVAALRSRRPQQRRQNHVQDQLGFEHDVVQSGQVAGQQSRDDKGQRGGDIEAAGHGGQQDRHHQNRQQ